ncbi:MAG: tetratricopeptide repeat protein [Planctomycetes bacterium]|nr:tetratricopeptide repeat protein [Planctomycetota bacterium]
MVLPITRSLAVVSLVVLASVPCGAQLAGEPAAQPPEVAAVDAPSDEAWTQLDLAITSLDEAIIQQLQWELWDQVEPTVNTGVDAVSRARQAGAPISVCAAVRETLVALLLRQDDKLAKANAAEGETVDESALASVAERLAFAEGVLPQTTFLRVECLFELARDDEAQASLSHGLVLWPANGRLHEQARTWANVLPDPEALALQLTQRVDRTGLSDPDTGGIALETAGVLFREAGRILYEADQAPEAAQRFERSVQLLQRSRSLPRSLPELDIRTKCAMTLVDESYAHLKDAKNRWHTNGPDDPAASESAAAAEDAVVRALEMDPENAEANQRAVLYIGDGFMTRGGDGTPRPQDFEEMRDFYGRMARRFDVADWWNNYAFWCRETGTTAENRGDKDGAAELYEKSYAAYQEAIRLEPDNARFVNDTGLMLFYHLGRDLDHAKELFQQAWKLGKDVCDNPFVDPAVYDENFSAYTDAMLNLARLYNVQGEYDRAKDVVDELLALAPNRIDAQMTRREIEGARAAAGSGQAAGEGQGEGG